MQVKWLEFRTNVAIFHNPSLGDMITDTLEAKIITLVYKSQHSKHFLSSMAPEHLYIMVPHSGASHMNNGNLARSYLTGWESGSQQNDGRQRLKVSHCQDWSREFVDVTN